jgi:UDP-N-acetylmuramate: L-alanyl-gamma-D-glutamyl-meso-diaminopimelate ligase
VQSLRVDARARWLTFGLAETNDVYAKDIEYVREGTRFTAYWEGKEWRRFETTLSGEHNVVNTLANLAIARMQGVSDEELQKGLSSFRGIKRRMEVRGVERGVTVIDDFAHHPTAVDTTLRGAKGRYPGSKIWALFEPRSISSSRKEFEEGYKSAFRAADRVIVGPVFHRERYETRYGIDKMMSVPSIVESLESNGVQAEHIESFDDIAKRIAEQAGDGDVIMVMSSGAFGGVHEKILEALRGS